MFEPRYSVGYWDSTMDFDSQGFIFTLGEDLFVIRVPWIDVEKRNIEQYVKQFEEFEAEPQSFRHKVLLQFTGYQEDPIELATRLEVRLWVRRLIEKVPYLFYYLTSQVQQMQFVYSLLTGVEKEHGNHELIAVLDYDRSVVESLIFQAKNHAKKVHDTEALFTLSQVIRTGIEGDLEYSTSKQ